MSFLTQMLGMAYDPATAGSRYEQYLEFGPQTRSGVSVNPDNALKVSAAWACVRLISETIASLPLITYQRLANGGRERATNHPLYELLDDRPNEKQTAFEYREMQLGHTLLRGNGYSHLEEGRRGFVDQLTPLHPDRVNIESLPADGLKPRYRYRVDGKTYTDAEILHVRGLSSDGVSGLDPITYARESLGLSLAGERYGARFFRNDARPTVVLKHPSKFKDAKTADRVRAHWNRIHGGEGQNGTAVLEEGMDLAVIGVDPRNAQFLELREFQAEDVCRWFRVPPHMVGLTSKATSWGSGIEQMSIGFVIYTLVPWMRRIEQAIARDLILAPRTYFVEHLVDGLLRGDLKARYDAYAIARDKGWYSVNDIRRKENENPIPGGDTYATGTPTAPAPRSADDEARANPHYEALVQEAAGNILRKEAQALGKAAQNGADWQAAVVNFYADHLDYVQKRLRLSADKATSYVSAQMQQLLADGSAALADWETRGAKVLIDLAME